MLPKITAAELACSLQNEEHRHLFVEVHDQLGNEEGSPVGYAVFRLTDTLVRFLEQRAELFKTAYELMTQKGADLPTGPSRLGFQFAGPVGFTGWDGKSETFNETGNWELSIDDAGEVYFSAQTNNAQFMSTAINVSALNGMGRAPENSYFTRPNCGRLLADQIDGSLVEGGPADPAFHRSLEDVFQAIAEAREYIEPQPANSAGA